MVGETSIAQTVGLADHSRTPRRLHGHVCGFQKACVHRQWDGQCSIQCWRRLKVCYRIPHSTPRGIRKVRRGDIDTNCCHGYLTDILSYAGLEVDRGEVQGGEIMFRLEYIGKAGQEALRRATGPHHKMPLILQRTLSYEPHKLVYVLPCDIRAVTYDPESGDPRIKVLPLAEAVSQTGIPRELLIAAAEEALIAAVGAPENRRNTRARRFPQSDAGKRIAAMGIEEMVLAFNGIPERVIIRGERERIDCDSRGIRFQLIRA